MTIYEVWDHDPMASSMGRDYIAARYFDRDKADADASARNSAWRADFERTAQDGKRRVVTEPWCWQHARVVAVEVV